MMSVQGAVRKKEKKDNMSGQMDYVSSKRNSRKKSKESARN